MRLLSFAYLILVTDKKLDSVIACIIGSRLGIITLGPPPEIIEDKVAFVKSKLRLI